MTRRRILVGVDGSKGADRAMQWAVRYAQAIGMTIVAAHVLTYSREFLKDLPPSGLTNWRRELGQQLESQWVRSAAAAGVPVETALHEAESVDAGILSLADQNDAELIVLGAHAHGDIKDRLLGAVTYRVSHQASRPVVIIPVDWQEDGRGQRDDS